MKSIKKSRGVLVTGVIGEDVHIVGMRILEHALSDAGFKVVSLGARTSQQEFVDAAVETKADVIMVSSLTGHAKANTEGLKEKLAEAGLGGVRLYIGGILSVDEPNWKDTEKIFKGIGFDRVYPPSTLPGKVVSDLEADLVPKA